MNNIIRLGFGAMAALWMAACAGAESGSEVENPARTQTLSASGECSFESCGSVPSSLEEEPRVECAEAASDACNWTADDGDQSTSYRECSEQECPERPAIDCPSGTVQASQQCGSENEGPCTWNTVCVPPRETTPCPESNGCDSQPLMEIGVICSDGTTGGFACVTNGESCYWERNCD